MDIPIQEKGFEGRGFILRTAGMVKGPCLLIDGQEALKIDKKNFRLKDNTGRELTVSFKVNILDPIPKLEMDGRVIELARPLAWYEYAWMCIPIVLLFMGGALGGGLGAAAVMINTRIFRNQESAPLRYLMTGMVSLGAGVLFAVIAGIIQALMGN